MTYNNLDDTETDSATWSRRRVLSALGFAAAIGGGSVAGQVVTQSTNNLSDRSIPDRGWTAMSRVKKARYSDPPKSETWAGSYDPVPLISTDQIALLEYIGTSWDPETDPTPDSGSSGAWQHTFVCSTLGASQVANTVLGSGQNAGEKIVQKLYTNEFADETEIPTVWPRPAMYAPTAADIRPSLKAQTVESPDGASSNHQQQYLAVSERHDGDLFTFLDPQGLIDAAMDTGVLTDSQKERLGINTDDYSEHLDEASNLIARSGADLSSDQNWAPEVMAHVEAANQSEGFVENNFLKLLGFGTDIASFVWDSSLTIKAAEGAFGVLDAWSLTTSIASAIANLSRDAPAIEDDRAWFYEGFNRKSPESGPMGYGTVVFDVYVSPGKGGFVDVSPKVDILENFVDNFVGKPDHLKSRMRVRFDGLPKPSDPTVAQYAPDDYEGPTLIECDSGRYTDETDEKFDEKTRPTDAIEAIEVEQPPYPAIDAPEALRSSDPIDSFGSIALDASKTILHGAPITSYTWKVFNFDQNGSELSTPSIEKTVSDPVTELHLERPSSDHLGIQRLVLDVEDANGKTGTTDLYFVATAAPDATPELYHTGSLDLETVIRGDVYDGLTHQITAEIPAPGIDIDRIAWQHDFTTSAFQYENRTDFTVAAPADTTMTVKIWDSMGRVTTIKDTIENLPKKSDPPIEPIEDTLPQDIDDDGLYEDINGDGEVNFPDVNTFFAKSDRSVIRDYPQYYDFTGDGQINLQDTMALFNMV